MICNGRAACCSAIDIFSWSLDLTGSSTCEAGNGGKCVFVSIFYSLLYLQKHFLGDYGHSLLALVIWIEIICVFCI